MKPPPATTYKLEFKDIKVELDGVAYFYQAPVLVGGALPPADSRDADPRPPPIAAEAEGIEGLEQDALEKALEQALCAQTTPNGSTEDDRAYYSWVFALKRIEWNVTICNDMKHKGIAHYETKQGKSKRKCI